MPNLVAPYGAYVLIRIRLILTSLSFVSHLAQPTPRRAGEAVDSNLRNLLERADDRCGSGAGGVGGKKGDGD